MYLDFIDIDLSVLFTGYYNEMKGKGRTYIPDTGVAKIIMIGIYNKWIKDELTPIEDLPREEKLKLVDECRATGNNYTNKTLIEQCKILYLIKNLNETTNISKEQR
jgi:hypothetical protein